MILAAPKLRFPEFKDPWKPGHAGDAFRNSRAKGAAGLPIYSVTMDRGLVRRDSLDRHMAADAADGQNLRAQRGDVVYNMMRMWQGAVGLAHEECMVSPAYVVLSPKKHTSSQFFDQWFKAKRMLYLLGAYSHGITSDRLRLYADDFARIPLHLPILPEQQKIAAFLGAVDAKLAALAAKQAALLRFKAGLMQKLFSQQLRFTRDDGGAFPSWEQKRLGELGKFTGGGTPDTNNESYWHGHIPWISSSDILENDLRSPKVTRFINDKALKASATKTVPANSILIVSRVGVGKLAVSCHEVCTSQDFTSFTPNGANAFFLGYWMLSNTNALLRLSQGTSIKGLTSDDLKQLRVPLPRLDEQAKIADALSAIDAKIQAVADQITNLQTFKKGLLQQMFV